MRLASSGGGERICAACARRCVSGEPADAQPVASDASTAFLLLTCDRVLPHESMCVAGEARTRAVCVSSAFCTRVLVCDAQRSECGRGSGEAEGAGSPGAQNTPFVHVLSTLLSLRDLTAEANLTCDGSSMHLSLFVAVAARAAISGFLALLVGARPGSGSWCT